MQQPEINPWGELTAQNALRAAGGARMYQPAREAQAMAGSADAGELGGAKAGDAAGPPLPEPLRSLHSSRAVWEPTEGSGTPRPYLVGAGMGSPSPPAPRGRRALPGPGSGLGHGGTGAHIAALRGQPLQTRPLLRRGAPAPDANPPSLPPGRENPPGPGCEPPFTPTCESSPPRRASPRPRGEPDPSYPSYPSYPSIPRAPLPGAGAAPCTAERARRGRAGSAERCARYRCRYRYRCRCRYRWRY